METEKLKKEESWKKTAVICATILALGLMATIIIFNTVPKAKREGAVKETAMLVDVRGVEKGTFRPNIKAMGTVMPSEEIMLRPRISGEIVEIAEDFIPGGFVKKGEMILKIDPEDYENNLERAKSELLQAEADLEIEKGRRNVAEKEYELIGESITDHMQSLVLRDPQLKAAEAKVASARAAVKLAQLELSRTKVVAPFDAHIIRREVNVGSQVTPNDDLAHLVGYHTYWIEAAVPMSKLNWLHFRNDSENSSGVRIRNRTAWPQGTFRDGVLEEVIGALEDQTRMARVLVSVSDPLSLEKGGEDLPKLMVGSFVEASIQAKELKDVIRMDRNYLRSNDTVWVMEGGKLKIKKVKTALRDQEYVYISSGMEQDDQVVITHLSSVVDGAPLRLNQKSDSNET